MKSTNIKISLDKRRAKTDGTYPVILRLTHHGQSTSLKTGIYVRENDWDETSGQVKNSYRGSNNVNHVNNDLQKRKAKVLDEILKLGDLPVSHVKTISDVRQKIAPEKTAHSIYDFTSELIQDLIAAGRIGTARSYHSTMSVLKTFNKGKPLMKNIGGDPKKSNNARFSVKHKGTGYKELAFEEIDYAYLKKLENYHLAAGNEYNGLAVYMRTIRSIYNQAIKAGKVDRIFYPFNEYKIKTRPTQKRALDQTFLKKIVELDITEADPGFDARNYFLASYFLYGMNFADMANLKKSDISNGRIHYRRQKTAKLYDIKITENLQEILSHYQKKTVDSDYLFPIIKRDSAIDRDNDIHQARKLFNKNLKHIAALTGIEQKLTSYVSRHSFATHAMLNNIPVNAISTMLGHSSLKTTEIYLKSLPSNILDDYNERILKIGTLQP